MAKSIMVNNYLYYGDNLDVLRKHIKDSSVDLIYLDPPFNSQANYNILFKEASSSETGGAKNLRLKFKHLLTPGRGILILKKRSAT